MTGHILNASTSQIRRGIRLHVLRHVTQEKGRLTQKMRTTETSAHTDSLGMRMNHYHVFCLLLVDAAERSKLASLRGAAIELAHAHPNGMKS